jgi:hypothetical protein
MMFYTKKDYLKAVLIGVFFSFIGYSNAQWIPTNGPYGGYIQALAANGNVVFAGTQNGVFISTNSGTNWTSANAGLPSYTDALSFAINGSNVFVGTGTIVVNLREGI